MNRRVTDTTFPYFCVPKLLFRSRIFASFAFCTLAQKVFLFTGMMPTHDVSCFFESKVHSRKFMFRKCSWFSTFFFLEMCVFSYETLILIALNLITNEYAVEGRNSRQENSGKLHISGHFSNDQLSTKGLLNSHNWEKPRKSGMNLSDQTIRYCEKLL